MSACKVGAPDRCGVGVETYRYHVYKKEGGEWILYGYIEHLPEDDKNAREFIDELMDKGYSEEDVQIKDTEEEIKDDE